MLPRRPRRPGLPSDSEPESLELLLPLLLEEPLPLDEPLLPELVPLPLLVPLVEVSDSLPLLLLLPLPLLLLLEVPDVEVSLSLPLELLLLPLLLSLSELLLLLLPELLLDEARRLRFRLPLPSASPLPLPLPPAPGGSLSRSSGGSSEASRNRARTCMDGQLGEGGGAHLAVKRRVELRGNATSFPSQELGAGGRGPHEQRMCRLVLAGPEARDTTHSLQPWQAPTRNQTQLPAATHSFASTIWLPPTHPRVLQLLRARGPALIHRLVLALVRPVPLLQAALAGGRAARLALAEPALRRGTEGGKGGGWQCREQAAGHKPAPHPVPSLAAALH